MPREKGVTQLEILRRKQAEITEQLKAAEAKEQEKAKQLDARRQELLGAIVLEYVRSEPGNSWTKTLFELVGQKLTRPVDRALFPELPSSGATIKQRKTARRTSAQPSEARS